MIGLSTIFLESPATSSVNFSIAYLTLSKSENTYPLISSNTAYGAWISVGGL